MAPRPGKEHEVPEVHVDDECPLALGTPHPLGATYNGKGVNFALFSAHATKVELCIYDDSGDYDQAARQAEETARRAADAAASGASVAAFAVFGIMLLGAIASVLGARRGTRDLLAFRGARVA